MPTKNHNLAGLLFLLKSGVMISLGLLLITACGRFEATTHPDTVFENDQGLGTMDEYGNFISFMGSEPRFRKARVTTNSSPLRLKTDPRTNSPAPSSGPTQVSKGVDVDVFWPLDVVNNHVKIYYEGQSLWVTQKSSSGQAYVTLLEDIYLPSTSSNGSGLVAGRPTTGGATGSVSPSDLLEISLSSSAVSAAHSAIKEVNLTSVSVPTCDFDPMVGSNSSKNNCYRQVVISQDFRNFVAEHGQDCAVKAGSTAFGRTPRRVLFHSSGAGQVRSSRKVSGSGRKSTHATGQAFDLFAISVYFSETESRKVVMHRDFTDGSAEEERQNHSFYWAFANCWRGRVQAHAPCSSCGSKTGALTYADNSAHRNHLHMSLPMCERTQYNVTCI